MSSFVTLRYSTRRTKIDLLKPSGRAERAIDTLVQHHKPSEAPGRPTDPATGGNSAATSRQHYFPCPLEFLDEIQRLAHVPRRVNYPMSW